MIFYQVIIVLSALVVVSHSKNIKDILSFERLVTEPDEELSPRVIGGRDARENEFPWMVALHHEGDFVCSAFLVTPKVVMTAAHCVTFYNGVEDPRKFKAYIGTINRDGPDTELLFDEIIAHQAFEFGSQFDIAIMRLKSPVTLADNIQTICLPTKDSVVVDKTAQVMGWGATKQGNSEPSKTLQTAIEYIQTNAMCNLIYYPLLLPITKRNICAGGSGDKGACDGDSGGPLVALNETKPVAIGITSFGSPSGCALLAVPVVYTNIASYTDWIVENMCSDAADLCFVNRTTESTRRWWG